MTTTPEPTPGPCPFCGSTNTSVLGDRKYRMIVCRNCVAQGPVAEEISTAATLWNRRSIDPWLRARLEDARARINRALAAADQELAP